MATTLALSLSSSQLSFPAATFNPWCLNSPGLLLFHAKSHPTNGQNFSNSSHTCRRLTVTAATGKKSSRSKDDEDDNGESPSVPSWAQPGSDEPPPWARQEAQKESSSTFEVPFGVYLLASAITAIAAIGSIFEYVNQRPVFGVLSSDSVFYTPLLGFFAFTGIPSSAFLWYKSVQTANKEAEEQDRRDGYL